MNNQKNLKGAKLHLSIILIFIAIIIILILLYKYGLFWKFIEFCKTHLERGVK